MTRSRASWRSARDRTAQPRLVLLVFALGFSTGAGNASGQTAGQVPVKSDQNAQARRWFKDAKFGLLINWGVYSLLGKGEWVMEQDRLPIVEYAKLPPLFDPIRFDAVAWVKLAKSAGARYITITAKHHDGFCMFASRLTEFDIVDAAPLSYRPPQGAGRRLPSRKDQAVLLLFAARLAPPRLFRER